MDEDVPPYHRIYRLLAEAAGITRLCDSDDPYIRLTEHPIDENSAYIFAINYSGKAHSAKISLSKDFDFAETVYGPAVNNGTLELLDNDGAIFLVRRKQEKG